MPLNVGSRLAHYDVTALIGEGSMGPSLNLVLNWNEELNDRVQAR